MPFASRSCHAAYKYKSENSNLTIEVRFDGIHRWSGTFQISLLQLADRGMREQNSLRIAVVTSSPIIGKVRTRRTTHYGPLRLLHDVIIGTSASRERS